MASALTQSFTDLGTAANIAAVGISVGLLFSKKVPAPMIVVAALAAGFLL